MRLIKTLGLISLGIITAASAQAAEVCESHKSIAARADDEICQYDVEASEDCFAKLNVRYEFLKKRGGESKIEEILKEANILKSDYESGIATLKDYLVQLKDIPCGDEQERIKVMIQEFQADLKGVNQKIKSLAKKQKPAQ